MRSGQMHYRKKRKPVVGIVLAIAAILLFAGTLFLIENKMKVREGKGDSGKWGSGISGKVKIVRSGLPAPYCSSTTGASSPASFHA